MQLQDTDKVSTRIGAGNVAVVEAILQQSPTTHVLLLGLLPRGDRNVEAPSVAFHQPSKCASQIVFPVTSAFNSPTSRGNLRFRSTIGCSARQASACKATCCCSVSLVKAVCLWLWLIASNFCSVCRFTPAIEAVNEKLKAYAQLNTKVDFLDCTPGFLEDDDKVWLLSSLPAFH